MSDAGWRLQIVELLYPQTHDGLLGGYRRQVRSQSLFASARRSPPAWPDDLQCGDLLPERDRRFRSVRSRLLIGSCCQPGLGPSGQLYEVMKYPLWSPHRQARLLPVLLNLRRLRVGTLSDSQLRRTETRPNHTGMRGGIARANCLGIGGRLDPGQRQSERKMRAGPE